MEDEKPPLAAEPVASNAGTDENSHTANNGIIKRIHLPEDEKVEREKFLELWHEQNRYIDHMEAKLKVSEKMGARTEKRLGGYWSPRMDLL